MQREGKRPGKMVERGEERGEERAEDDGGRRRMAENTETTGPYFPETNEAYETWVGQHPHGYVINALKSQGQDMYWHRADCPHIGPAEGWTYIGGDLMKTCTLDPGILVEWAKQRPEKLHYCKHCRTKWVNEQGTAV
jgi:hypothetical protein